MGTSLDILVQSRRNTKAANRFMRKIVKRYGEPRVLITDKLGSYCAAKRNLIPGAQHRQHKGLNNNNQGFTQTKQEARKDIRASNQRGKLKCFWQPTIKYLTSFVHAAVSFPPFHTDMLDQMHKVFGASTSPHWSLEFRKSRASLRLLKLTRQCRRNSKRQMLRGDDHRCQ